MAFVLACGIILLMVLTVLALAPQRARRIALAFALAGLFVAVGKIALFQQTPQWRDINPDSITYERNGRAFAAHWQNGTLAAKDYNLRGLQNFHAAGLHGPDWEPNDRLSYALIIGTCEWLYAAYVGMWYWVADAPQALVIWSNALWAGLFPASAFGLALALGAPRRTAIAAGGLALIDPSAGVNASWLLKDTLAGFLAMTALWAMAEYQRDGGLVRILVAVLALGLLGGVRYVAFVGFLIAAALLVAGHLYRRRCRKAWALSTVMVGGWLFLTSLYSAPHHFMAAGAGAPVRTTVAAVYTLQAHEGDLAADETTIRWKNALAENPPLAMLKSVAHTLFAPYPWVAIHPGLNWSSFSELYYPGVLLWILCLPGIFRAIAHLIRHGGPAFWLVLLFLLSQLAAYTIWLGEWSTRQRVYALPAFFALAAMGAQDIFARWRSHRATRSQSV